MLEGYDLVLIEQDGTETPVDCKIVEDKISFTLNSMPNEQPVPVLFLKLIPRNEAA